MSLYSSRIHNNVLDKSNTQAVMKHCLFPNLSEAKLFRHFSTGCEVYTNGTYDYVIKVILLGDQGVGKTSFLKALKIHPDVVKAQCMCRVAHTVDHLEVEVNTSMGHHALVRLCDTGGQERYRSLTSSYYRGAHGVLLVFDVNNMKSLENIEQWLSDLETFASASSCVRVLLGSKSTTNERKVAPQVARKYAESRDLPYMEFDSAHFFNVIESLKLLVDKIAKEVTMSPSNSTIIRPVSQNDASIKKDRYSCFC
ncbi:unnamed protein product [Lymnaea stagnalis]|uniref:Uncharacterized protein n=1 Tax=Lymnaea stagnalis TaxID=6523 RepID=A0AAV2HEX9_LYMST